MKLAVVARSLVLALLAGGVFGSATTGCVSSVDGARATGSADVVLSLGSALDLPVGGHVEVTVSGAGISPAMTVTLAQTATGYAGTIDAIPVGSGRTFAASLFDAAGLVLYRGQVAGVTVDGLHTAMVELFLQPAVTPGDFSNRAPAITSLSVSSLTAKPGDAVRLAVGAVDPEGEAVTYRWAASDGTFDDASLAAPMWTAGAGSEKASQTLSVQVSDPHGASSGASVTIGATITTGSADITASLNRWPTVSSIVASASGMVPGATVALSAVASDPDGDALTYSWAVNCPGALSSGTSPSPTLTFQSSAFQGVQCDVFLTIRDGRGASAAGTLRIPTGEVLVASPESPVFDEAWQSDASTLPGGYVSLRARAHTVGGAAATLTWSQSVNPGGFGQLAADGTSVNWYMGSPSYPSPGMLTVTARDPATGGASSRTFNVAVRTFVPVAVHGVVTHPLAAGATKLNIRVTELDEGMSGSTCTQQFVDQGQSYTEVPASVGASYSVTLASGSANLCSRKFKVELSQLAANGSSVGFATSTCAFVDLKSDSTSVVCDLP